ncbi:MAG: DciA family protein [Candidatus Gracilibacteria bacterium]|nr:DciA family protein [Candidatus Gracilibacteria bacterium]
MFTRLSDLMPSAANKNSLSAGELRASMIVNRAGVIIKMLFPHPKIHSQMKVRTFTDEVLRVSVQGSAVSHAFQTKSHEIKRLLNESMEGEVVKEIRVFQEVEAPEEDPSIVEGAEWGQYE